MLQLPSETEIQMLKPKTPSANPAGRCHDFSIDLGAVRKRNLCPKATFSYTFQVLATAGNTHCPLQTLASIRTTFQQK